jgi:hypothetical protein
MDISLLWKILYWSWIVTEVLVLLITRTRRGGGEISDRGSLIVLWVVIFCSLTAGGWAGAVCTFAAFPSTHRIRPLALGVLALGLVIRWSAIYTLGRSFSANVAIHSTQTLNRSGLFRYMRHPSYTGMVVIFLAMGLRTRNWLGSGVQRGSTSAGAALPHPRRRGSADRSLRRAVHGVQPDDQAADSRSLLTPDSGRE